MEKVERRRFCKTPIGVIFYILLSLIILLSVCGGLNQLFAHFSMNRATVVPLVRTSSQAITPGVHDEIGVYFELPEADYDFVILHITDTHIGGGFGSFNTDYRAIRAVESLVREVEPHLVVVTGDILYAVPFQSPSFNNLTPARIFVRLMDSLQVPWTVTMGNHESPWYNVFSRGRIAQVFEDGEYSLFSSAPDIMGYGNHTITLKYGGKIVQALIMMDTNDYRSLNLRDYDTFHPCQVDWYEDTIIALNEWNIAQGADPDSMIRSIMFYHIAISDLKVAFERRENTTYVRNFQGRQSEGIASGDVYSDILQRAIKLRSTHAMFFGHDHLNTYSLQFNGGINVGQESEWWIHMSFAGSIDFLAYFWIRDMYYYRGGNIVTVNGDGSFTHTWLTLYRSGVHPANNIEYRMEVRTIDLKPSILR